MEARRNPLRRAWPCAPARAPSAGETPQLQVGEGLPRASAAVRAACARALPPQWDALHVCPSRSADPAARGERLGSARGICWPGEGAPPRETGSAPRATRRKAPCSGCQLSKFQRLTRASQAAPSAPLCPEGRQSAGVMVFSRLAPPALCFALCVAHARTAQGAAAAEYALEWSAVPAAAVPSEIAVTGDSSCACDLTLGGCDGNCCCDTDCAPEEQTLFSCDCSTGEGCLAEAPPAPSIQYCNPQAQFHKVNLGGSDYAAVYRVSGRPFTQDQHAHFRRAV